MHVADMRAIVVVGGDQAVAEPMNELLNRLQSTRVSHPWHFHFVSIRLHRAKSRARRPGVTRNRVMPSTPESGPVPESVTSRRSTPTLHGHRTERPPPILLALRA